MATIKTWQQRCEEHPDGIVTNLTTRNFMQKEIDELRAKLDALEKQEPVMLYGGRCIFDCGDGGHQDVTMLKLIPKGAKLYRAAGAVEQPAPAIMPIDEYERGRRAGITNFYDALYAVDKGRAEAAIIKLAPELAPLSSLIQVVRKIRACEGETAAQLVLEHAIKQHTPPPLCELSEEQIAAIVREHLTAVYHCTRVWEAWGVGTMGEDDFEPADESDMPEEIARAVLAAGSKG